MSWVYLTCIECAHEWPRMHKGHLEDVCAWCGSRWVRDIEDYATPPVPDDEWPEPEPEVA